MNPTNVVDPREGGNKKEKQKNVSGLTRAARVTRAVSNAKEPPNIGGAVYCHRAHGFRKYTLPKIPSRPVVSLRAHSRVCRTGINLHGKKLREEEEEIRERGQTSERPPLIGRISRSTQKTVAYVFHRCSNALKHRRSAFERETLREGDTTLLFAPIRRETARRDEGK